MTNLNYSSKKKDKHNEPFTNHSGAHTIPHHNHTPYIPHKVWPEKLMWGGREGIFGGK